MKPLQLIFTAHTLIDFGGRKKIWNPPKMNVDILHYELQRNKKNKKKKQQQPRWSF